MLDESGPSTSPAVRCSYWARTRNTSWVRSRCARAARRSLVNATRPRDTAGQVALPAPVSCTGRVQPETGSRRDVNTFHRQSADRESYHTARTAPSGSPSSRGRWLIADGSSPTASGADHVAPPSSERLARSERLAPALRSSLVSQPTTRLPAGP